MNGRLERLHEDTLARLETYRVSKGDTYDMLINYALDQIERYKDSHKRPLDSHNRFKARGEEDTK